MQVKKPKNAESVEKVPEKTVLHFLEKRPILGSGWIRSVESDGLLQYLIRPYQFICQQPDNHNGAQGDAELQKAFYIPPGCNSHSHCLTLIISPTHCL